VYTFTTNSVDYLEYAMANRELMKALEAVVSEYANGRGPLVKFEKQNEAIVKLVSENKSLFRYLGTEHTAWHDIAC